MSNLNALRSLYLVQFSTDDGDSLDWFVIARDKAEAVKLWREHEMVADFIDDDDEPEKVWAIAAATPSLFAPSQVLEWGDHGVQSV